MTATKKAVTLLTAALFAIILLSASAHASETEIKVVVDGVPITFDQEPFIVDGRVMVPVEPIAEALDWSAEINKYGVYLKRNGDLEINPGKLFYTYYQSNIGLTDDNLKISHRDMVGGFSTYHFKHGHYPRKDNEKCPNEKGCGVLEEESAYQLTAKPVTINGVLLIAIRDLAAALYAEVDWQSELNTVTMTSMPLPYYDGAGLPEEYRDWLIKRTYEVYNPHGSDISAAQTDGEFAAALEHEVLRLVNEIREDEGLTPFTTNTELSVSAQKRAEELPVQFTHTRPNGESASSAYLSDSLTYCSENILKATAGKKVDTTAVFVVDVWMRSPGHRANLLSEGIIYMGLGTFRDGNGLVYCAQGFMK